MNLLHLLGFFLPELSVNFVPNILVLLGARGIASGLFLELFHCFDVRVLLVRVSEVGVSLDWLVLEPFHEKDVPLGVGGEGAGLEFEGCPDEGIHIYHLLSIYYLMAKVSKYGLVVSC